MSDWYDFLVGAKRSLFSQAHTHRLFIERIMLEIPLGGKILEAGCGLAYLSKLLADVGYRMTAGDIDDEVLAAASRSFQLSENPIIFTKLDLLDLQSKFDRNEFDAIVHSGVMEHFSDEAIIQSFVEQKAVAKALIFKVPNKRTKMSAGHFGDERFLTDEHWVNLLKMGGYNNIKVFGGESLPVWTHILPSIIHMYPKKERSSLSNRVLTKLSAWRRYFSRHSIFVCR